MSIEPRLQNSLRFFPAMLLVTTILLNILWPLTDNYLRDVVTIAGVLTFFIESKTHAFVTRGFSYTVKFVFVVLICSFLAEVIGVNTGVPFGTYHYGDRLGPTLLNVPLLIPFAWFMMLYPSTLVAQTITASRWKQIGIAGWLMATWDLFLDPQMVNEGYWWWFDETDNPTNIIPLSNFVGWFLVSVAILSIVYLALGQPEERTKPTRADRVPYLAIMWVWLGSFLANIVPVSPFLNQPRVALTGLIGMGIVLAPWLWRHHRLLFTVSKLKADS